MMVPIPWFIHNTARSKLSEKLFRFLGVKLIKVNDSPLPVLYVLSTYLYLKCYSGNITSCLSMIVYIGMCRFFSTLTVKKRKIRRRM